MCCFLVLESSALIRSSSESESPCELPRREESVRSNMAVVCFGECVCRVFPVNVIDSFGDDDEDAIRFYYSFLLNKKMKNLVQDM